MHATLSGAALDAAYGAILASIGIGANSGAYTLGTADSLFGQRGLPFLQSYLSTSQTDYGAALQQVDFAGDPDSARNSINAWVAGQTENQIRDVLAPGDVSSSTVLALANAVIFQGTWDVKFDASETNQQAFTLPDGTVKQVAMMHKVDDTQGFPLAMTDGEDGWGYVFPYAGLDLALVVLEPDPNVGLATLESHLAMYDLPTLIEQAGDAALGPLAGAQISLPKFQIASSVSLAGILQALGVHSAFDAATADFSGIDGRKDLWLDQVLHQATIKVDESGTKASGATVETLTPVSTGGTPEPFEITIDHSFAYLLYDRVTGNILFMGRVIDPTVQ